MTNTRPAVPKALERRLKEEAGYRCAIQTCKGTSILEMAHIEPWSKVKAHTFENMIVLCAICHGRFDREEIPVLSIRQFKANLSLLSHRYTQVENQILRYLSTEAIDGKIPRGAQMVIHPGMKALFTNLLEDGLFEVGLDPVVQTRVNGRPQELLLRATEDGSRFVERMLDAENLE